MIIYVDILILTNTIIDYFMLLLVAKINKSAYKSLRIIISAFFGGISSLYIFLNLNSTLIDIFYKTSISVLMCLISFGWGSYKALLRNTFSLFAASFIFAGFMMALWQLYSLKGIIVNNSTVYFGISPQILIICAVIIYFLITVAEFFIGRKNVKAKKCEIKVCFGEEAICYKAIFDTGNNLRDNFSDNEVVLLDLKSFNEKAARKFSAENLFYKKRYRILPCKTVAGQGILEGFRADLLILFIDNKSYHFKNPIIVFSKESMCGDYNALLDSEILTRLE